MNIPNQIDNLKIKIQNILNSRSRKRVNIKLDKNIENISFIFSELKELRLLKNRLSKNISKIVEMELEFDKCNKYFT